MDHTDSQAEIPTCMQGPEGKACPAFVRICLENLTANQAAANLLIARRETERWKSIARTRLQELTRTSERVLDQEFEIARLRDLFDEDVQKKTG